MREAPQARTAEDEPVQRELEKDAAQQREEVVPDEARSGTHLPSASPVQARRRALQPHCVSIGDAERGKQRREGVADERGVEMLKVARAEARSATSPATPELMRKNPRPCGSIRMSRRHGHGAALDLSRDLAARRVPPTVEEQYGKAGGRDGSEDRTFSVESSD